MVGAKFRALSYETRQGNLTARDESDDRRDNAHALAGYSAQVSGVPQTYGTKNGNVPIEGTRPLGGGVIGLERQAAQGTVTLHTPPLG